MKANNTTQTTSHHVNGFWFHIKWDSDKKGYDQRGNLWLNKENPVCDNPNVVIACKNAYINILETMNNGNN